VHTATVVARWSLHREGQDDASGHTMLVLQRGSDGWRIVQDASM
jgi:hypothetical protein